MTVVVTVNVEGRYRGFLASVMLEIAPGVYTSPEMTSGIRDRILGCADAVASGAGQRVGGNDLAGYGSAGSTEDQELGRAAQGDRGCRRRVLGKIQLDLLPWRIMADSNYQFAKGSPARAGIDPGQSRRCRTAARFPRTRGDRPRIDLLAREELGVPPHARG